MGRITICQAADDLYAKEMACTRRRAHGMGYEHFCKELRGTLPSDFKRSPFLRCTFKPKVIKEALLSLLFAKRPRTLVYLDADVALAKPLEIEDQFNFDVGVVLRPSDEIADNAHHPEVGLINTGVLLFNVGALPFLDLWIEVTGDDKYEQQTFNELLVGNLGEAPDRVIGILPVGQHKIRTRIFPRAYHAYAPSPDAYLVHFKGGYGDKIHQFCGKECDEG